MSRFMVETYIPKYWVLSRANIWDVVSRGQARDKHFQSK